MIRATAGQVIGAELVNATTGGAFVGTVTVYVTLDGAGQTLGQVGSGLCQAEGNGYYTYQPSKAETDGALIGFTFTGTGAVPTTVQVSTTMVTPAVPAGTLVRDLIRDALLEIGVLYPEQTLSPAQGALGLLRLQSMIDASGADQLTLSKQLQTPFTLPGGTSTVTVGPGGTVNITRPVWVNALSYVIPGSSPAIEVPIGLMDEDTYAGLTIKSLPSALPTLAFYQTNLSDNLGTLFFWPQVTQTVQIMLYTPQQVDLPVSLNTVIQGPPGYHDWFLYELALRLVNPMGVAMPPLLGQLASRAYDVMLKPNVSPGLIGLDAAVTSFGGGGGFNVLTGTYTGSH